ncbi:palmitoyl-acyl carrier protein thioesterase, chloroplastic-like [Magnolia sinica]|uniref:palmitoyl-acyl carrier protein thioesterase, chloroplastic-like n=1 Tax=Magnolia sinica TaxID=86752 RepID=UPI00265B56C1|nr:palmitoyl-acyl carrier protein thioesterase, chloroplastic-like [Magnolia sinica]
MSSDGVQALPSQPLSFYKITTFHLSSFNLFHHLPSFFFLFFSMASFSSHSIFYPPKCSSTNENDKTSQKQKSSIKINGSSTISMAQSIGPATAFVSTPSVAETGSITHVGDVDRQNIPTKKQSADPFRQGLITDGGVGYTQTVVVRSYEVGADKTATLETILNLLQETALNHVWMSGLLGDGFGATHGMMKNNLIWVVTRMQVQVHSYPIWGEVVDINTWVGASGKNGMRRDWMIRSHHTGHVFARATSTWVMMNKKTRRLSKMPEEVRAEIFPWFIDRHAIQDDGQEKIIKLDDKAKYVNSDLKPKRSDLDMNHHVNNVKYVRWMLETIPELFLEAHQLSSIILEYRRECGSSDIVQSLCQPDENSMQEEGNNINILGGFCLGSEIFNGQGLLGSFDKWPLRYTHLVQIKGGPTDKEIVRGRTKWKKKLSIIPFSTC